MIRLEIATPLQVAGAIACILLARDHPAFQMLGAGDKAGSGIDKIRASWAAERWQSPVLRESHQPDRVILELPMVSLLPEEVLSTLRQRFGSAFDHLSGDEVQAVVTAQVEGEVTNLSLQGMLTMHRVDITRMLRGLVREGFLKSDGVGRGTRYFLSGGTPHVSEVTSLANEVTSPVSEATSPVSAAAPPVTVDLEVIVAQVRAAQRAKPEQMRQAIQFICAAEFLTAQQIAEALGRSKKRLQDEFLGPMCASGLLSMRYPDTPNHKQQAYRGNAGSNCERQGRRWAHRQLSARAEYGVGQARGEVAIETGYRRQACQRCIG